ncbi:MAG: apolipoprotein N-acyltransferase, partial [Gammaproteobacteria bacterium]
MSRWRLAAGRREWLALGGGLLLPLAFAPFGYWPLALVAMALLFHCWTGVTARRAALRGWLFGLGLFGLGVSWVQVSIHQFGLPSLLFSVPVTLLFVAFMALYPAACGALAVVFAGRRPPILQWILLMPALWVLTEAARGWLFTGFPWLQLGTSQIDSALAGYSPVGGDALTGFLCALSGGLLLAGLQRGGERVPVLLLLVLVWGGGGWLRGHEWTEPAGPPLEVAVVQGAVPQAIKWAPGQLEPTRRLYLRLSRPHFGRSDLILWPETALPAFEHQIRPFLGALDELAKVSGSDLLLGLAVREEAGRRYYNGLLSLGRSPGRYYKRHLVPFGEYLPLKAWLGGVLGFLEIPMSDFSPGSGRPLLRAAGRMLGASICYEDAFPG